MNHGDTPISIRVARVRVLDESNEASDSDEPYVVAWMADLRRVIAGEVIPSADITVVGPWEADEGDLLEPLPVATEQIAQTFKDLGGLVAAPPLWGLNGEPEPIPDGDDVILLIGMMEHDEADPDAIGTAVNGMMAGALAMSANSNLTRAQLRERMRQEFSNALHGARMVGLAGANFDDRVAPAAEFTIAHRFLEAAALGQPVVRTATFQGGSEGSYRVAIEIRRG